MPLSFGARADHVPRSMLLLLRLYVGGFFFQASLLKLSMGNFGLGFSDNLTAVIAGAVQKADDPLATDAPFQFYAWFLEVAVLPNPNLFALLVTWSEFAVATSLFFGVAARLGAGVAIFLSLNYALLSGQAPWEQGINPLLIFVELTLLVTASGRYLGFDYFFNNRWPKAGIC